VIRGIRGAISVDEDTPTAIGEASLLLVETILDRNRIAAEDVSALFITMTGDLSSVFPAEHIRKQERYRLLPIICSMELPVPGAKPRCVRMLVLAEVGEYTQGDLHHVYLGEAQSLRPDLENEE